ncbi:MAG: glycosyltransferase family 87 protein [Acidimicrobiia bacterium]
MIGKIAAWVLIYLAVLVGLLSVGRYIALPDRELALARVAGALASAAHVLTGQEGPADFLVDYASAAALRDGVDPYEISEVLIERVGERWPVSHANPHPPTLLALVLPLTVVHYEWALAAWSLAMVGVLIATFRLVGVRLAWAVVLGFAIGITWPGAYGITNPVPLIGLGVAAAWRWRDTPAAAGAGIALAAAPKLSGLLLVVPFLFTGRVKALVWGATLTVALAVVPLALDTGVWTSYFDSGVEAIDLNIGRADNASLLGRGIPGAVVVSVLAAAAIALAMRTGDVYWPTVWLMVAALPIAWMYSLLTLIPALVRSLRYSASIGFVIASAAVMVGSAPLGQYPTFTFGLVVALAYLALWGMRDELGFPLPTRRGLRWFGEPEVERDVSFERSE